MWEIWTNELSPKALKSCPKSNKLPNLVTLEISDICDADIYSLQYLNLSTSFSGKLKEKTTIETGPKISQTLGRGRGSVGRAVGFLHQRTAV